MKQHCDICDNLGAAPTIWPEMTNNTTKICYRCQRLFWICVYCGDVISRQVDICLHSNNVGMPQNYDAIVKELKEVRNDG